MNRSDRTRDIWMHAPLPEQAAPLADADAARLLAGLTQFARGRTPRALSRGIEAVSPVLGFAGCSVAVAPEALGAAETAAVRTTRSRRRWQG
jgi:hypothetical protein